MNKEMNLSVNSEKWTILINNEEYYSADKGIWHPDNPAKAPKGNKLWYNMGLKNVFLFNEDAEYGIKLFGRSAASHTRVKRLMFRDDDFKKLKWQQLNKEQIEKLAYFHQELSEKNLSPKCKKELLSFNNGSIYGLEVEYIKNVISVWEDEEYRGKIRQQLKKSYREIGINRRHMDMRPCNFRYCQKRDAILLVDIEYMHLPQNMK